MASYRFGFIGAGAMAAAIADGMIKSGLCSGSDIILSNRSQEKLQALQQRLGIAIAQSNEQVAREAAYIIIAVKPQQFAAACGSLQGIIGPEQTVVSIMAGLPVRAIKEVVGNVPVCRAMPNTPAQIGWGMTGVACDSLVTEAQKAVVQAVFESVGKIVFIEEGYMDAVGAVSGSGPAYMYQIIEALADGAVLTGLPRAVAYQLVAQTMAGSAMMLLETGEHPGVLKDQVTSPGGTTIRALKAMEAHGVRSAMMEAVQQAYLRSKELGEGK